jgi:hypothetical protein
VSIQFADTFVPTIEEALNRSGGHKQYVETDVFVPTIEEALNRSGGHQQYVETD